jgi:hypothetical protein
MDAVAQKTPNPAVFLVFGDLHGRILPAFRFASYWANRSGREVTALLQVGDMGYFPDPARMDKASLRHAKDNPLEFGAQDVAVRTELADRVFQDDPHQPSGLWFTAGNHEDFEELERFARASGNHQNDFAVDAYCRVRGIKDGAVQAFDCALKAAAVWGVDGAGPNCRQRLPQRAYIAERAVDRLTTQEFDVLLMHDALKDAKRVGYGSELLAVLIELAQPQFAFFGHYSGDGARIEKDYGRTEVYHLAGFELRTRDGHPESGSVGVLTWDGTEGSFEYVPDGELKPFTRHNWKWV